MYRDYLNNKIKLDNYQLIGIILLVVVISGLFGFIYEFIFYFLNSGMKTFYWQGGNFLPWINIYAYGALLIMLLTYKIKKQPLLVFLISVLATGLLEYVSGLVIYKAFNGLRLWDYNTEILNFGNINGFVCLRSVLFFGLSALVLVYLIIPLCFYLSKKLSKKIFLIICISLFSIVIFDELYNLLLGPLFNMPRARDIYQTLGIKYMHYKHN